MRKNIFLLLGIWALGGMFQLAAAQKNKGKLSNLVVFVRFLDQDENSFSRNFAEYEKMFNDSTSASVNSVYNYFKTSSYNQLFWKTGFFPKASANGNIIAYKTENVKGYYQPHSEINPDGYKNDVEAKSREQGLIKEIANYLSQQLPADFILDANNDGLVDNICLIFNGTSDTNASRLLWPHRGAFLLSNPPLIHGKRIAEYLMVFDDGNGIVSMKWLPLDTGILCHEMSHTLGTYDLYHEERSLNPVGVWDLMSNNTSVPQQMLAYTKYRYCLWLDEIPEISTPGVYTLNPIGGNKKEKIAYKIKPLGSEEYFVVEYRRKSTPFDATIPESGLLVYRINPAFSGGNIGYNGTTRLDETYIFRPGGTINADGQLEKAAFSAESGRTTFGGTSAHKPFYSNGSEAKFAISEVSACGETISFRLLPFSKQIYLPLTSISLLGAAGSSSQAVVRSDVAWKIEAVPDWLEVSPRSAAAGETSISIVSKTANQEANLRKAVLKFVGNPESDITASLEVTQRSNLIHEPTGLKAQQEGNKVNLSWSAAIEGSPLFSEGFEGGSLPEAWSVSTAGYRKWEAAVSNKTFPAFQGNYFLRLQEAFEERHQDEKVLTPPFKQGKTLSFRSRSTAVGKKNKHNFYEIKISNDGGLTWKTIFDLKKDGKLVNKYEQISIDISAFASDNMQVAFHAWDDNNLGLAYRWQLDNVAVYPAVQQSIISGYNIYRNGVKIGHSTTTAFTDEAPLVGKNSYTVRASGSWGETSDSEKAELVFSSSNSYQAAEADKDIRVYIQNNTLYIQAASALRSVKIYSMQGALHSAVSNNATNSISLSQLPQGIYLASILFEGDRIPRQIKFIKR